MTMIDNVKHRNAILLKFGGKFLTSLTKLVLEGKPSICFTVKENLLASCRKFSPFAVAVIISPIFIARSVSQRNTASNRNH